MLCAFMPLANTVEKQNKTFQIYQIGKHRAIHHNNKPSVFAIVINFCVQSGRKQLHKKIQLIFILNTVDDIQNKDIFLVDSLAAKLFDIVLSLV